MGQHQRPADTPIGQRDGSAHAADIHAVISQCVIVLLCDWLSLYLDCCDISVTGCIYTHLPQGGVDLDLYHVQGVEVGHKQVGLSVGWKRRGEEEVTPQDVCVCVCLCVCVCGDPHAL